MERIRESITKDSLENLNWPLLKKHLDEIGFDKEVLVAFLGHLRRTNSLIMPYPNTTRERARDTFFREIIEYVQVMLGIEECGLVTAETSLLLQIEKVYRAILNELRNSDISKFPPEIRVASYIDRMAQQYAYVVDTTMQAMASKKEIMMPDGPLLTDDKNQPVSPDRAISALIESLTITLVMEAIINKWIDSEGYVVLPALPSVNDDLRFKAGSTELLSLFWRHWRNTEERRRFIGGDFVIYERPDLPEGTPESIRKLTIYSPDDEEFFDYAANRRLTDRMGQNFLEMMFESNVNEKCAGINGVVPLPPDARVSPEEVHAGVTLSELLSYSIVSDDEQPGGLRLLEWVRGYSVLKRLASNRRSEDSSVSGLVFTVARNDLLRILINCGLEAENASRFIDLVTLSRSSRDLFDCPLIKMMDGSLLVFAPAIIPANIAQVVLSQISNLGEPLERKGKAFEQYIISFLNKNGLGAKSFKANREGNEYQYDAVFVWGDYIFLFECKNHALSHNHPIQAYYFGLELQSNAKQVIRLTTALNSYPDILKEQLGVDVTQKKIIPCVINALTYTRPGKHHGVYFTDASMLKRFFQERYFHLKTPYQIDKDVIILHRTAMHSLWSSDTPSPDDLLQQLEDPFQLRLILGHTELGPLSMVLNGEVFISHVYRPTETSVESVTKIFGLSQDAVREEMNSVKGEIKRVIDQREKEKRPDE